MLSVYRRHRPKCKFKDDRISKKCRCALWGKGTLEGRLYQKSLKTRSFERAQQIIRELEDGTRKEEHKTLDQALKAFVAECESRNLAEPTLRKYRKLSKRIQAFGQDKGIARCCDFTADVVRDFRGSWDLAARTGAKELERVRAFFRFCEDNDWIKKSPAKGIKAPVTRDKPVLPFTEKQVDAILKMAANFKDPEHPKTVPDPRTALFINVLLLTGLRIVDVSKLTKERIQIGRIFLYSTKTGVPVSLPLPEHISKGLESLPSMFATPTGTEKDNSLTDYWRDQIGKVFLAAGIKGHPHQFRHTMARRLLEAGASVEDVADILGNSPNIVRKHYAPWVASRQSALDSRLMALWEKPKLVRVK